MSLITSVFLAICKEKRTIAKGSHRFYLKDLFSESLSLVTKGGYCKVKTRSHDGIVVVNTEANTLQNTVPANQLPWTQLPLNPTTAFDMR
jgi:hypothetical protein